MQFPYEQEAMNGYEMPDGLNLWQQHIYLSLRSLYQQYRSGAIDRKTAIVEKRMLEKAAIEASRHAEFQDRMTASTAELWRRIEAAGTAYAKERTLEHADAFYEAVYRVGAGHGRLRGREGRP